MDCSLLEQDIVHKLSGFWALISWDVWNINGLKTPYSKNGVGGFIHYTTQKKVSVCLYELHSSSLITSYGGGFEYLKEENALLHIPVVGSSPQGLETPKKRYFALNGDQLTLETGYFVDQNTQFKYTLQWKKIP